jgi:hypothetical protein
MRIGGKIYFGIYLLAEKIADSRGTFKKQRISDSSDK